MDPGLTEMPWGKYGPKRGRPGRTLDWLWRRKPRYIKWLQERGAAGQPYESRMGQWQGEFGQQLRLFCAQPEIFRVLAEIPAMQSNKIDKKWRHWRPPREDK